ncbi:hypothetical protein CBOM_07217 [Ceraceosorus bombacis]|uniref:Zn(2)-C6 fungal-type domain-containing protein n=1 Tax=Ceraceosorus bombacis TaxID=401625 RepID=A0A0P1B847_9BASI|nr:hypothetical protein CBOM_07217 [Ceraceosorus bombacis]
MSATGRSTGDAKGGDDPPSHGAYLYELQAEGDVAATQDNQVYRQQQQYSSEDIAAMAAAANATGSREGEALPSSSADVNAAQASGAGLHSDSGSVMGEDQHGIHDEAHHENPGPSRSSAGKSNAGSKRQRVHFSCTECHRRKQKCNRETPCNHCIARKVPERCRTFQPGEEADDVASRLTRLEHHVEDGFNRLAQLLEGAQHHGGYGVAQQPRDPSSQGYGNAQGHQSRLPAPLRIPAARGAAAGATNVGPSSAIEEDDDANEGGRLSPKGGTFHASGAYNLRFDALLDKLQGQPVGVIRDPFRTMDTHTVDEAMSEMGAMLSVSYSLVAALPPRHLAESLLDHWFEDINWLRQPLSQTTLRKEFDELWASGPVLTASNITTYAVLVCILAIATLSFPRAEAYPEDPRLKRLTARRLQFAGRRALLCASMLPNSHDLNHVIAWNLSARFCLIDRRVAEGWSAALNAVAAAWAIGLHRDGSTLGLSPEESEARRLAWGATAWLERALAANLGRPTMIDDAVCDAKAPLIEGSAADDVYPRAMAPSIVGLPPARAGHRPPHILDYAIHRQRLGQIVGKVINVYQCIPTKHYSDVLAIEGELEDFTSNLPPYFQSPIDNAGNIVADQDLDSSCPLWLFTHRYLLHSDIAFLRGALHRPYLLRSAGGKAGARFMPSRRAAIQTALRDVMMRRDFVHILTNHYAGKIPDGFKLHLGASHRAFSSCLTLGVASLMEPHGDETLMWRSCLEQYCERVRAKASREAPDELKDRELAILELFISRLDALRAGEPSTGSKRERSEDGAERSRSRKARRGTGGAMDEEGDAHATAGLLLGLGRSDSQPQRSHTGLSTSSPSSASGAKSGPSPSTPGTSTRAEEAETAQALLENWWRAEFEQGGSVVHDEFNSNGLAGFDRLISTAMPYGAASITGGNNFLNRPAAAPSAWQAQPHAPNNASGVPIAPIPPQAWNSAPAPDNNAAPAFDPAFWQSFMGLVKPG